MSEVENARRVHANMQILLSSGTFPGSLAHALAEAQQYVADMITKLDERAKQDESAK